MDWNQWYSELKAKRQSENGERLESAKKDALASGKEPFDLHEMDKWWPTCPDKLNEHWGCPISPESRIADWQYVYYIQCPSVRTMQEFAAKMISLQGHGAFDV